MMDLRDSDNRGEAFLVLRAQLGDREALDALLRVSQEWLHRYLLRLTGSRAAADDVLQQVLVLIYKNLGHLNDARVFRSWAYRIASREAFRAIKKHRPEVSIDAVQDSGSGNRLLESLESAPSTHNAHLSKAVFQLSSNTRVVIVLHYYEGLSIRHIADVLGLAVGTVKSRLASGLAQLRSELKGRSNDKRTTQMDASG